MLAAPRVRSLVLSCWFLFASFAGLALASRADEDPAPTVQSLRTDLRDRDPDKRRRAVRKLAALRGEEAKELVLASLSDSSGKVGDAAQLAVIEFEGDGVARDLLGAAGLRSRDETVRLRAAEAIGRLAGPVDAGRIARAFDRRDPRGLRHLLWSVERLAERDALGGDVGRLVDDLQKLLGRRVRDDVRAAALQALVVLAPSAARRAFDGLQRVEGRETRCAYLMAVTALDELGAEGILERAASDVDPMVRLKALELLCQRTFRSTPALLVDRLQREPRPVVRERVVDALRWLTGMRHGDKLDAWRHTVQELPAGWSPARTKDAFRERRVSSGSVASIRRLDPGSDRVAILVDFSGSLWHERADGTRRKDLLDPELVELLERLDQKGSFLLAPYTSRPHPFSEGPIAATRRNVLQAQRFFRKSNKSGQGNLYDAARLALSFDEIDRIIVLTDGAPTGGLRWDVDLMIELLAEATRFRPVVFDFVLLDAPSRLERRWRALAESTGGRTISIAF